MAILLPLGALARALSLTVSIPVIMDRQPPQPSTNVCAPVASVVAIRVVDATGKAVARATVSMVRLKNNESLGPASEMGTGSGQFALLESTALRWLDAGGERIRVTATDKAKQASTEIVVGRDSTNCRISQLSGAKTIVLK